MKSSWKPENAKFVSIRQREVDSKLAKQKLVRPLEFTYLHTLPAGESKKKNWNGCINQQKDPFVGIKVQFCDRFARAEII